MSNPPKERNSVMMVRRKLATLALSAAFLMTGCAPLQMQAVTDSPSSVSTETPAVVSDKPITPAKVKQNQYVLLSARMHTREVKQDGKEPKFVTVVTYTVRDQNGVLHTDTVLRSMVKVIVEDIDYGLAYGSDSQLMLGELTFVVPKDGVGKGIDLVNVAD